MKAPHSVGNPVLWLSFAAVVLALLVYDLGFLHRRGRGGSLRSAAWFTLFVVVLAAGFDLAIYWMFGVEPALEFLTGYVVEEALSVDNLFIFLLIFKTFRVPQAEQHRVLFWGIFGALTMRAVFIAAGTALVAAFHWIFYVFGAFLIFTGIKLLYSKEATSRPEDNAVVRLYRKLVPSTDSLRGSRFFVREGGRLLATPLLLVLVVVEVSDIVFAVDSIPAIFAVTTDPFLVYTSNVFAILGLRSLYFLLAGMMDKFYYLHHGLGVILAFVGLKMLLANFFEIPTAASLGVIFACLGLAIFASLMRVKRTQTAHRRGSP